MPDNPPVKVYYHNQVFSNCLSIIENKNIESTSLIRKLDVAIYYVADFEERAFDLFNDKRRNELISIMIEFVERIIREFPVEKTKTFAENEFGKFIRDLFIRNAAEKLTRFPAFNLNGNG